MEETNPEILEARAKLAARFDKARIGGKGSQRRKTKAKSTGVVVNDDKKLQGQFKKLSLGPIPGIEEVNMFTSDNHVIHFKEPKVLCNVAANTYVIQGSCEAKSTHDMLPRVINQMGDANLVSLRKDIEQRGVPGGKAVVDDIPDIVGDTNFEEVSKS